MILEDKPVKFVKHICGHCGQGKFIVNGAWLRYIRYQQKRRISLGIVARHLELSRIYISQIENNKRICPKKVEDYYRKMFVKSNIEI